MLKFDRYEAHASPDRSLASLVEKEEWVYPLPCVRDNSYFYILKWLDWVKRGKWSKKGDGIDIPNEFHYL